MNHRLVTCMVAALTVAAVSSLYPSRATAQTGPKYWQALEYCNQHRDLTKDMVDDPACQEFVRRDKMAGAAVKRAAGYNSLIETQNRMRKQELERQQREQQQQRDSANWAYASQAQSYERAAQRAWAFGDANSARRYQAIAQRLRNQIVP